MNECGKNNPGNGVFYDQMIGDERDALLANLTKE